jgi:hypothetical protein
MGSGLGLGCCLPMPSSLPIANSTSLVIPADRRSLVGVIGEAYCAQLLVDDPIFSFLPLAPRTFLILIMQMQGTQPACTLSLPNAKD